MEVGEGEGEDFGEMISYDITRGIDRKPPSLAQKWR